MEYWGRVGYEPGPGSAFCDGDDNQGYSESRHGSNGQKHMRRHCRGPAIVAPPKKLGFYDSLLPYGRLLSGVKTYAEATKGSVKALDPEACQPKVRPGARRVGEILARLNYLASKNGFGLYDLVRNLEKDARSERLEKVEEKAAQNARHGLDAVLNGAINLEYDDYVTPSCHSRTAHALPAQDLLSSVFHPGQQSQSVAYTAPIAGNTPHWLNASRNARTMTSGRSQKGVESRSEFKNSALYRDSQDEYDTDESEDISDYESSREEKARKYKK